MPEPAILLACVIGFFAFARRRSNESDGTVCPISLSEEERDAARSELPTPARTIAGFGLNDPQITAAIDTMKAAL